MTYQMSDLLILIKAQQLATKQSHCASFFGAPLSARSNQSKSGALTDPDALPFLSASGHANILLQSGHPTRATILADVNECERCVRYLVALISLDALRPGFDVDLD